MQTFTVDNAWGKKQCSAAMNVFGMKGSEGVKSEGKRAKRERVIIERHWHVRDLTEEPSNVKREERHLQLLA